MKKGFLIILMLALSSVLLASNMGFKLTKPLVALDGAGAPATNVVSVPYFWLADSAAVWADLLANSPAITPALITVWNPATASSCDYYADPFGLDCNAPMVAGQAIMVVIGDATNKNWVIVGSHNPATNVALVALDGAGAPASNVVSYPYHGTATDSAGIWTELIAKTVTPALITVWDGATASSCDYYADPFGLDCNATISAGTGMIIAIGDATNKTWIPNHY